MSVNYQEIVPVCAPCGQGVERLRSKILKYIPERGKLFPDGCTSLHSERFLVSEQIRISLFSVLPVDIAASTAVQIEEFSIRDEKRYVRANLHVARHSNKGVVIGRKGAMLQNIADIASKGASRMIERPLYLDLWVKVRESWPENRDDLRRVRVSFLKEKTDFSNSYRIELEAFEGPLDLLLYLLRRDEIDIYDIPVAHVADQFLNYIRAARELDLDIASEYLVMAATLTKMKSKALLPTHGYEGEEEADPGAELRRQLILYRTFREIAEELQRSEETWTEIYTSPGERSRWSSDFVEIEPGQASLLDLLKALNSLSEGETELPSQRIQRTLLTITECIGALENRIVLGKTISFKEIIGPEPARLRIVSYFITILELIRRGWIRCHQAYPFSEIELQRTERWSVDS